jgi:hypothetical protein
MRHHLPRPKPVTLSTTHELSPSPRRCSLAHNTIVLPKPMTPSICSILGPAIPSSSQTPWRPRAHDTIKTVPPLILQRRCPSRARNVHCIFFCHFGPTNPDFYMLHCHIALICYIAFVLLHFYDMLHCHILLLSAALLWYATLTPYVDVLNIAKLHLFFYILIDMNAYYNA